MPITKSAKKALRQTAHRTIRNTQTKNNIKKLHKQARKLIAAQKHQEAQALLPQLQQAVDKAAKRGIIKQNTASRRKAFYTRMLSGSSATKENKA
jgi:small subunit ribosomal protein S20